MARVADKIAKRGINLGGWLVVERWMTPSLFASNMTAENEYELSANPIGQERIRKHRKTFIQEDDIKWLASIGIEIIRLPVGYWALADQPPYISAKEQIDWLMDCANKYGLKVLIDLHAAPGAQNENDHGGSGKPGETRWYQYKNKKLTKKILKEIAREYKNHPALWGIELLNEPLAKNRWQKIQLWWWSYRTTASLHRILEGKARIVVSDAYDPDWWAGKIPKATLDIHHYQCFIDEDIESTDYSYHAKKILRYAKKFLDYAAKQPTIIGEWSAALPIKTANQDNSRDFCNKQLSVKTNTDAWFFWSYKTENNDSWNFKHLYNQGYFDKILPK